MSLINPLNKKAFLLLLFFLLIKSSGAEEADGFIGVINEANVNIRSDSTVFSETIFIAPKNQRVEVVKELYDWYKIRLPEKAPSYIYKELTKCIVTPKAQQAQQEIQSPPNNERCLSAEVKADSVNIRFKADKSSIILGKAKKGEVVSILEEDNEWYKIKPIYESFGWVNKRFVARIDEKNMAEKKKEDLKNPLQTQEEALIGIIKPVGKFFGRQATHKLITEEKEVYLLHGDKKTLDTLSYRKVRVTRQKPHAEGSKNNIIEVKTIELLQ